MNNSYYQKLTKEIYWNKQRLKEYRKDRWTTEANEMECFISGLEYAREWFRNYQNAKIKWEERLNDNTRNKKGIKE